MLLTNDVYIDDYQLLYDAYTGGGGFADARYIIAHKREDAEKLMERRNLSYYSNHVHPVVDALSNPIFRKPVVRDFNTSDDKMIAAFRDDVDGKGTSMNAFMKKAAKLSRLFGAVFIVEDNFPAKTMPINRQGAFDKRIFPYLYLVKPQQVKDYICDQAGILESITYTLHTSYQKSSLRISDIGNIESWTWTKTEWIKKSADGNEIARGDHLLGRVPIIPLFATEADDGEMLPVSPMLSIAKMNQTIFNLSSELREILRSQAFSVLRYPITREVSQEVVEKGLTLGTNNALPFPGDSSQAPDFIAPPSEPAILLQNEIKRLVDDIYRQANLTSVVAVQTKQSGVAKEWDFEQTNQALADMAEACEMAENVIFKMFGQWTNINISEMKIKYDRNFGIVDVANELDKAQKIKDIAVGGSAAMREIDRKIVELYFSDIDDDRYDEIMQEIDDIAQAAGQVQVFE